MFTQRVEDAFNEQINKEYFSSYLYLSMSAFFDSRNLKGMAQWMRIQAQEEHDHMMRFFDYILERGGKVNLTQVDAPRVEWGSPQEAFEEAYQHECMISGSINDLVDLCLSEKDHASNAFLQWFVTEQVEEEASTMDVLENIKLAGGHRGALYMLDKELGQRKPPVPSAVTEE